MSGQGDDIVYPKKGQVVHYETELAVVMGKPARHVSEERALDYVLGYTCGNDVSERVIQAAEMATGVLLVSKGFDTFCPLGPVIATGLDPSNLALGTRLNGVQRQDASTSDLLFSVPELIAYITEAITLLPGDVIMTGTPSGVGPMAPGDTVEVEVEGVGILRNPCGRGGVAATGPLWGRPIYRGVDRPLPHLRRHALGSISPVRTKSALRWLGRA